MALVGHLERRKDLVLVPPASQILLEPCHSC